MFFRNAFTLVSHRMPTATVAINRCLRKSRRKLLSSIFLLSAFPASNYLQLRGFPDLMLLTTAQGGKGIVELSVASLIYWLVRAGFSLK